MTLSQLVYVSRPAACFRYEHIAALLESARTHNAAADITGALAYRHDLFMQILEGEREPVSELFGRINADERHDGVVLVGQHDVASRAFPTWSMGYLRLGAEFEQLLRRHGCGETLDFTTIASTNLVAVMRELFVGPESGTAGVAV